jgi:hypothetical protein
MASMQFPWQLNYIRRHRVSIMEPLQHHDQALSRFVVFFFYLRI